jgi:putative membrane protein
MDPMGSHCHQRQSPHCLGSAFNIGTEIGRSYTLQENAFLIMEELHQRSFATDREDGKLSDHLANERTFLAWVRTSIGIMAFGFVVVKFTLFVKQISIVLQKPLISPGHGYSNIMGIFLVAFGAILGLLAFYRYKTIDKQLRDKSYHPSTFLSTMLIACILLMGILLVLYLIQST